MHSRCETKPPSATGAPWLALLAALLAALVAFALYAPSLGNGFAWDSAAQIETDNFIHDPANLRDVLTLRVLGRDVLDFNRPVNLLSLMADAALWGRAPFGYHLTNNLLHAATAALLCALLMRLLALENESAPSMNRALVALGAALLFAVHPVNAETVAEVSYREDLLATMFTLGGLLAATARPLKWRHAVLCVACLFFAAASKETGVTGPMALLVCLALFRGDVPRARRAWLVAVAGLAVGAFLAVRFALEPKESVVFPAKAAPIASSWAETLVVQSRIVACYLRNIVWPAHLCADYGPDAIRDFGIATSLAVVLVVMTAQVLCALRSRLFALGAVVFWVALLPVSNLVPIFRPMADRYLYMPLTGAAMMLAAVPARAVRPDFVLCAAAAVALAVRTGAQQRIWHDDFSLWTATAAVNPASHSAANNLAFACFERGDARAALDSATRAIRIGEGRDADDFAIAALALDALGRGREADAAFRKAVALDAAYADPDNLVARLTWTRKQADKLKVISQRN